MKRAAPTVEPVAQDGQISSWNPSSGRGLIKLDKDEIPFDVMQTELTNEGYVDLYVGRPVTVVSTDDAVESVTAN